MKIFRGREFIEKAWKRLRIASVDLLLASQIGLPPLSLDEIAVSFWLPRRGTLTRFGAGVSNVLPRLPRLAASTKGSVMSVHKPSVSSLAKGQSMSRTLSAVSAITILLALVSARGQDVDGLLQQATHASQRGEHERAITKLTEAIKASPATSFAWYLRGREHFRAGKITESVADFDKYVQLEPQSANQQWERGISYYYAGEYAKGAKQFEDYQKFHDQDVENSVWRYLCVARASGVEKAKANLLPITEDRRVPMMQIYGLYQGKLKPEDVLAAANANPPNPDAHNQRLFYAHLYIGLWHEAAGNAELAKKHLLEADQRKIAHYMWDVAHVHAQMLKGE
jgi:lipoprotein NlpI